MPVVPELGPGSAESGRTGRRSATGGDGCGRCDVSPGGRKLLMLALEQYLRDTAAAGGAINTMFEERIFALVGILERIAVPLDAARIPYELIGGGAVMVHVDRIDNSAVRNTKDLDIMVNRADLDRIRTVAEQNGFTFRRAAGL